MLGEREPLIMPIIIKRYTDIKTFDENGLEIEIGINRSPLIGDFELIVLDTVIGDVEIKEIPILIVSDAGNIDNTAYNSLVKRLHIIPKTDFVVIGVLKRIFRIVNENNKDLESKPVLVDEKFEVYYYKK